MSDFDTQSKGFSQAIEVARLLETSIGNIAAEIQRFGRQLEQAAQLVAPPVIEAFQSFAKAFEQLEKADREVFSLLARRGWLVSPSALMGASIHIHAAILEQGIDTVEQELIATYSPEKCEAILLECIQRPSFAKWRQKLLSAMKAHKNGDYDLAVPIWLIAVEGILVDELSREGRNVQDVFSNGRTKAIRGALKDDTSVFDLYLDAFLEVIKTLGRQTGPYHDRMPVLSRHDVMHGRDPDFGMEKDSIQCILLLEVVHMLLEEAERRSS